MSKGIKCFLLSFGILSVVGSFIIPIIMAIIGFITLNNIGIIFIISMALLISGFMSIKNGLDMY